MVPATMGMQQDLQLVYQVTCTSGVLLVWPTWCLLPVLTQLRWVCDHIVATMRDSMR
jgi:hypothetical protein